MPATFVQSKSNAPTGSANATTVAATFGAAVGSGHTVYGIVGWDNAGGSRTLSGVADDKGNTYTVQRTVNDTTNQQSGAVFFLGNITNGPVTVTATFSIGTDARGIAIGECSGVQTSPLDVETGQLQTSPGTGTDGATSGAVVTTANGDFVVGLFEDTGSFRGNTEFTAGTGFTQREQTGVAGANLCLLLEDRVQSSAGSIAGTATHTNNDATISFVLTFKATVVSTPAEVPKARPRPDVRNLIRR